MSDIKSRLIIEGDVTGQDKVEGMAEAVRSVAQNADELAPSARAAGDDLAKVGSAADDLQAKLKPLAGAIAGIFAVNKIKGYTQDLIGVVDAYGQYASRMEMATESTAEYERVQARLLDTANRTYRPLAEAQELFIRTSGALKNLNYTTEEAVDITDSFSFLLTTNAASADKASSAVDAYSKAIQTNKVNTLQWQSIANAMPTVVDAIATATGKSAAEVRKLGVEGKLALADLNEGLRQTLESNKAAAENMTTAVGDAVQRLKNTFSVIVGEANRASGATDLLVGSLDVLSDNLETLMSVALLAGEATVAFLAAKAVPMVAAFGKSVVTSVGAMRAAYAENVIALKAAEAEHARYSAALKAATVEVKRLQAAQATGGPAAVAHAEQLAAARARLQMFGASAAESGRKVTDLTKKTGESALGVRKLFAAIPGPLKIALSFVGIELLPVIGKQLGELAAKATGVDEAARKAAEDAREAHSRQLASGRDLMLQYEQYKDTVALSAAEVARMSETERAGYQQRVEGAREYWRGATRAQLAAQELGVSFELTSEQIMTGIGNARAGMTNLADGAKMTADDLARALSVDASVLITQFDQLRAEVNKAGEEANTVEESLKKVVETFNPASLESVRGFGQALVELENQGKISAAQAAAAWEQALSKLDGAQLELFRQTAQAAFGSAERDVLALDMAMDNSLRRSIAATGQDFALLQTGIGKNAGAAIGHLDNLVGGLDHLKQQGVNTGEALKGAINFAIDAANSEQALQALRLRIIAMGESGDLGADQVTDALNRIKVKSDELKPGIDSVAEALKKLGVASDADLKKTADGFKNAYEQVVKMGGSVREQREAFAKYAEAGIAANKGVADSALKAQAGQHGVRIETDETGKSVVKLGENTQQTGNSVKGLADSSQQAGQSGQQMAEGMNQAAEATGDAGEAAGGSADITAKMKEAMDASVDSIADVSQAVGDAARVLTNSSGNFRHITDEIAGLDAASLIAGDSMKEAEQSVEEFSQRAESAAARAKSLKESLNDTAIDWRPFKERLIAYAELEERTARIQQNMARLDAQTEKYYKTVENGNVPLEVQQNNLKKLVADAEEYGSQRLSELRSALDEVTDKLQRAQEESTKLKESVLDELDQAKGNLEQIEQRKQEARIAEIEAKLAEARAAGDRESEQNYIDALKAQKELQALKIEEARANEAEARARKEADKAAAAKSGSEKTGSGNASSSGSTTTSTSSGTSARPSVASQRQIVLNIGGSSYAVRADENTAGRLVRDIATGKGVAS